MAVGGDLPKDLSGLVRFLEEEENKDDLARSQATPSDGRSMDILLKKLEGLGDAEDDEDEDAGKEVTTQKVPPSHLEHQKLVEKKVCFDHQGSLSDTEGTQGAKGRPIFHRGGVKVKHVVEIPPYRPSESQKSPRATGTLHLKKLPDSHAEDVDAASKHSSDSSKSSERQGTTPTERSAIKEIQELNDLVDKYQLINKQFYEQIKQLKVVNLFDECSVPYRTVIGDLQTAINEEIFEEDYTLLIDRGAHRMTWTKYHNFDDMNDYLKYLEQFYPDRVTLINIGQSFEKRNMTVVKITNGSDKKGKKAIWVDGGMHAREWVSPATVMFMVHRLAEFQSKYKDVFEDFDWYLLPLANPDGYEYSMTHDRLWRKTRSVHQAHNGTTCVGVDPNRNFGYKWRSRGSSDDPCADTYAGPSPFSESETRAIRDFLLEHKDVLELFVTFHAYSQMWMMPWASSKALPNDYDDMRDVALKATAALKKINGTEYMIGSVTELLYVVSGSSDDFAKGVVNIPYTYSVELRDRGRYGFILPPEYIEPTGMETLEGMLAMTRVLAEKKKDNSNKPAAKSDLGHDTSKFTATAKDLLGHEVVAEVKLNTLES